MNSMIKGLIAVITSHLLNLVGVNAKPRGNDYFDIKRVGNKAHVQAKQKLGSFGSLVMSKDAIDQVMRSTRSPAYDENAFFGISGNCLKDLRVGQNLVCILRRKEDQLKMEMVQGGHGILSFGDVETEMVQIRAFQELYVPLIRLFNVEEIKVEARLKNKFDLSDENQYSLIHK
jgi:hypothetical protein